MTIWKQRSLLRRERAERWKWTILGAPLIEEAHHGSEKASPPPERRWQWPASSSRHGGRFLGRRLLGGRLAGSGFTGCRLLTRGFGGSLPPGRRLACSAIGRRRGRFCRSARGLDRRCLGSRIAQSIGGDLLELLRQRSPPLQRIGHPVGRCLGLDAFLRTRAGRRFRRRRWLGLLLRLSLRLRLGRGSGRHGAWSWRSTEWPRLRGRAGRRSGCA